MEQDSTGVTSHLKYFGITLGRTIGYKQHIDGEIPKACNSTFGNCSGEGKNCPIFLYIINAINISVLCSTTVLIIKLLNVVFNPFLISLKITVM